MTGGSCGIRCSRSGLRRISLSAPTADSCGYLHQFQCFFSVGISNTPCRKKAPRSKRAFPRSPLWRCQRLPFPLSADRPVRRDSSFQGGAPAENRKKCRRSTASRSASDRGRPFGEKYGVKQHRKF